MRRVSVLRTSLRLAVASAFLLCVYLGGRIAALAMTEPDIEESVDLSLEVARAKEGARPMVVAPRDLVAIAERNMFCSGCSGAVIPQLEQLPVRLVATHVAADVDRSIAAVEDVDGRVRWHARGELVPGAGIVESVGDGWLEVEHEGRRVRIAFSESPEEAAAAAEARPSQDQRGIRALSATSYEVDRSFVEEIRRNPGAVRGVRVLPKSSGDQRGMFFSYVSKKSLAASLGVRRGDLVTAVNGVALDSLDAMVSAYGRFAAEDRFSVSVVRRGERIELRYRIVD